MGGKMMIALLVALAMGAALPQSSYAVTHTVGGSSGWMVPRSNSDFYDEWADNQTFAVGDVLAFTFTTGTHDVAEVTEAEYEACTATNPISTVTTGPASITLNSTGDKYFICTFTGHCSAGQKLKVEVNSTTSASTPGSSPTTPSGTTTPSGNSASSLVSTLSLVFLSIATLLFFC